MTDQPYRPEFVEVEVPPRVTVEGTCAWCGAAIRYRSDEGSARCPQCGAQSARALAPKRRERKRWVSKPAPRSAEQTNPTESPPAPAPLESPVAPRVAPPARYLVTDLGPVAVPLIGLSIGGGFAALLYFPVANAVGSSAGAWMIGIVAACYALALTWGSGRRLR